MADRQFETTTWTPSEPFRIGDTVTMERPWPRLVRAAAWLSGVSLPARRVAYIVTHASVSEKRYEENHDV